mmetsp:Transcript_16452/g.23049  ORF Transcript_16452/g.23049 Transcript_16452/m.23049 type:complete len:81 (+) Transcript_16452:63-305(+)
MGACVSDLDDASRRLSQVGIFEYMNSSCNKNAHTGGNEKQANKQATILRGKARALTSQTSATWCWGEWEINIFEAINSNT